MSNLYVLKENWKQVSDMLYEEEIDEQMILDTLESIEGEIEDKADGYAKIIKNLLASSEAKKTEAKALLEKAKAEENKANLLKTKLEEVMRETGKVKFKTALFSFSIQKNGGLEPLSIDIEAEKVPFEYYKHTEKELDNTKIREALKEGKIGFAHLEPRRRKFKNKIRR